MTSREYDWISAAQALAEVIRRFRAATAIDEKKAQLGAIEAMLQRLTAGTLRASPRGLFQPNPNPDDWRQWFHVRLTPPDDSTEEIYPDTKPEWKFCAVPPEFWRLFLNGDHGCVANWDSGDFYLHDVVAADGIWNGMARDVYFDRERLPGMPGDPSPPTSPTEVHSDKADVPKRSGGRIPEYDWIGAIAHLVAIANGPNGLDPTGKGQERNASHIARLMEAWFDTTIGDRPSDSMVRKYASQVVGAINDLEHRETLKAQSTTDE